MSKNFGRFKHCVIVICWACAKLIGSSVNHQGKGFARKTSVTLGSIYCVQDEGNGLFYSIPLCHL